MPGEKIVVSGNFLIDSESRMRAAAQGIFGSPTKDPVCGMFVDEDKTAAAGMTSTYKGRTYFFCKEECKTDFDKDPKKYVDTKLIPHVSASHEDHNKAISRASKENSPKSAETHGGSGTQLQNADKSLDKRQEEARDRDFPGAQYLEQDRKYYKMDEMKDTESAPGSRTESGANAETKPALAPQPAGK
jgi:YHS domain-containing protein